MLLVVTPAVKQREADATHLNVQLCQLHFRRRWGTLSATRAARTCCPSSLHSWRRSTAYLSRAECGLHTASAGQRKYRWTPFRDPDLKKARHQRFNFAHPISNLHSRTWTMIKVRFTVPSLLACCRSEILTWLKCMRVLTNMFQCNVRHFFMGKYIGFRQKPVMYQRNQQCKNNGPLDQRKHQSKRHVAHEKKEVSVLAELCHTDHYWCDVLRDQHPSTNRANGFPALGTTVGKCDAQLAKVWRICAQDVCFIAIGKCKATRKFQFNAAENVCATWRKRVFYSQNHGIQVLHAIAAVVICSRNLEQIKTWQEEATLTKGDHLGLKKVPPCSRAKFIGSKKFLGVRGANLFKEMTQKWSGFLKAFSKLVETVQVKTFVLDAKFCLWLFLLVGVGLIHLNRQEDTLICERLYMVSTSICDIKISTSYSITHENIYKRSWVSCNARCAKSSGDKLNCNCLLSTCADEYFVQVQNFNVSSNPEFTRVWSGFDS